MADIVNKINKRNNTKYIQNEPKNKKKDISQSSKKFISQSFYENYKNTKIEKPNLINENQQNVYFPQILVNLEEDSDENLPNNCDTSDSEDGSFNFINRGKNLIEAVDKVERKDCTTDEKIRVLESIDRLNKLNLPFIDLTINNKCLSKNESVEQNQIVIKSCGNNVQNDVTGSKISSDEKTRILKSIDSFNKFNLPLVNLCVNNLCIEKILGSDVKTETKVERLEDSRTLVSSSKKVFPKKDNLCHEKLPKNNSSGTHRCLNCNRYFVTKLVLLIHRRNKMCTAISSGPAKTVPQKLKQKNAVKSNDSSNKLSFNTNSYFMNHDIESSLNFQKKLEEEKKIAATQNKLDTQEFATCDQNVPENSESKILIVQKNDFQKTSIDFQQKIYPKVKCKNLGSSKTKYLQTKKMEQKVFENVPDSTINNDEKSEVLIVNKNEIHQKVKPEVKYKDLGSKKTEEKKSEEQILGSKNSEEKNLCPKKSIENNLGSKQPEDKNLGSEKPQNNNLEPKKPVVKNLVSKISKEKNLGSKTSEENNLCPKKSIGKNLGSLKPEEQYSGSKKPEDKNLGSKKPEEKKLGPKKSIEKKNLESKKSKKQNTGSKKPEEKDWESKKSEEKINLGSKKSEEQNLSSKKPKDKNFGSNKPEDTNLGSKKPAEKNSRSKKTKQENLETILDSLKQKNLESMGKKFELNLKKCDDKISNYSKEKSQFLNSPISEESLYDKVKTKVRLKKNALKPQEIASTTLNKNPVKNAEKLNNVKNQTKDLWSKNLKCKICDSPFLSYRNLKLHKEFCKTKSPNSKTDFQINITTKSQSPEQDLTSEDFDGKFKCSTCNEKYSERQNFYEHLKKGHCKSSVYECQFCRKMFKSLMNFETHYLKRHCKHRKVCFRKLKCQSDISDCQNDALNNQNSSDSQNDFVVLSNNCRSETNYQDTINSKTGLTDPVDEIKIELPDPDDQIDIYEEKFDIDIDENVIQFDTCQDRSDSILPHSNIKVLLVPESPPSDIFIKNEPIEDLVEFDKCQSDIITISDNPNESIEFKIKNEPEIDTEMLSKSQKSVQVSNLTIDTCHNVISPKPAVTLPQENNQPHESIFKSSPMSSPTKIIDVSTSVNMSNLTVDTCHNDIVLKPPVTLPQIEQRVTYDPISKSNPTKIIDMSKGMDMSNLTVDTCQNKITRKPTVFLPQVEPITYDAVSKNLKSIPEVINVSNLAVGTSHNDIPLKAMEVNVDENGMSNLTVDACQNDITPKPAVFLQQVEPITYDAVSKNLKSMPEVIKVSNLTVDTSHNDIPPKPTPFGAMEVNVDDANDNLKDSSVTDLVIDEDRSEFIDYSDVTFDIKKNNIDNDMTPVNFKNVNKNDKCLSKLFSSTNRSNDVTTVVENMTAKMSNNCQNDKMSELSDLGQTESCDKANFKMTVAISSDKMVDNDMTGVKNDKNGNNDRDEVDSASFQCAIDENELILDRKFNFYFYQKFFRLIVKESKFCDISFRAICALCNKHYTLTRNLFKHIKLTHKKNSDELLNFYTKSIIKSQDRYWKLYSRLEKTDKNFGNKKGKELAYCFQIDIQVTDDDKIRTLHNYLKKLFCQKCNALFGTEHLLKNHILDWHNNVTDSHNEISNQNSADSHNLTSSQFSTSSQNLTSSLNSTSNQNTAGSHNLTSSQNSTCSKNLTGSHDVTSSQNLTCNQNSAGNHNLTSTLNSTCSKNLTGSHNLIGNHSLTSGPSMTSSHNLTNNQNLTGSYNLTSSQNLTGSHNLTSKPISTTSQNLTGSHNLIGNHNITSGPSMTSSHNLTNNQNLTGSHNSTSGPSMTSSYNLTRIHDSTSSNNLTSSHNSIGSHNLKGSQILTASQNLISSLNSTSGPNITNSHNLTGSYNFIDNLLLTGGHNSKGSHNLTSIPNFTNSQNLVRSHNLTGYQNFASGHNLAVSHNLTDSHGWKSIHNLTGSQIFIRNHYLTNDNIGKFHNMTYGQFLADSQKLKEDFYIICPICFKDYSEKDDFYTHMNNFHKSFTIYKCQYCQTYFDNLVLFVQHQFGFHKLKLTKDREAYSKKLTAGPNLTDTLHMAGQLKIRDPNLLKDSQNLIKNSNLAGSPNLTDNSKKVTGADQSKVSLLISSHLNRLRKILPNQNSPNSINLIDLTSDDSNDSQNSSTTSASSTTTSEQNSGGPKLICSPNLTSNPNSLGSNLASNPNLVSNSNSRSSPNSTSNPNFPSNPNLKGSLNLRSSPKLTCSPILASDPNLTDSPNFPSNPNLKGSPNLTCSLNLASDPNLTDSPNSPNNPNLRGSPNFTSSPKLTNPNSQNKIDSNQTNAKLPKRQSLTTDETVSNKRQKLTVETDSSTSVGSKPKILHTFTPKLDVNMLSKDPSSNDLEKTDKDQATNVSLTDLEKSLKNPDLNYTFPGNSTKQQRVEGKISDPIQKIKNALKDTSVKHDSSLSTVKIDTSNVKKRPIFLQKHQSSLKSCTVTKISSTSTKTDTFTVPIDKSTTVKSDTSNINCQIKINKISTINDPHENISVKKRLAFKRLNKKNDSPSVTFDIPTRKFTNNELFSKFKVKPLDFHKKGRTQIETKDKNQIEDPLKLVFEIE